MRPFYLFKYTFFPPPYHLLIWNLLQKHLLVSLATLFSLSTLCLLFLQGAGLLLLYSGWSGQVGVP